MNYWLHFTMLLPRAPSPRFITGHLRLVNASVESLRVHASSGLRGFQILGRYGAAGKSPIPASNAIQGAYAVDLRWVAPDKSSAEGSRFYLVSPNPVLLADGSAKRVGIGIHYDANYCAAPGSAGCIVALPRTPEELQRCDPGWNAMKAALDEVLKSGVETVPLIVEYQPFA